MRDRSGEDLKEEEAGRWKRRSRGPSNWEWDKRRDGGGGKRLRIDVGRRGDETERQKRGSQSAKRGRRRISGSGGEEWWQCGEAARGKAAWGVISGPIYKWEVTELSSPSFLSYTPWCVHVCALCIKSPESIMVSKRKLPYIDTDDVA